MSSTRGGPPLGNVYFNEGDHWDTTYY